MPMQQRQYATSHGTIVYWIGRTDEHKPWLIFLPGLTADHRLFDRQIEHFCSRYNCLVWDAPAHGLSRPFELTFSTQDLAQILHEILEYEHITAPFLIGQSLGGYIAQTYVTLYSASGFISIDSSPMSRKYYAGWELFFLRHTESMYNSIPWKPLIAWSASGTSVTCYGRQLMKDMLSAYQKKEFGRLAGYYYRIFVDAAARTTGSHLPCPVLLLCGKQDAAGSVRRYNRAWAAQDGHSLIWIDNAGHNANTDAPETVNRLIEDFIRALSK